MRRFIIQIVLLSVVGTAVVLLFGTIISNGARPLPDSDAGDMVWNCYDEQLKTTTSVSIRGQGHLCLGERSIKVVVEAEDLTPGEVYTVWMAYVEVPSRCTSTPCPLSELTHVSPPSLLNKLDVTIADETRRATFGSTFRGLRLAQSSQVQLLLVAHGSALIGDGRAHQILGAHWPGSNRDASKNESVIARTHFPIRWSWD